MSAPAKSAVGASVVPEPGDAGYDPGPNVQRTGQVTGQLMMDLDTNIGPYRSDDALDPKPLEHTEHGMVYDSAMPERHWSVGGANINDPDVVSKWTSAPTRKISAGTPIYTGQPAEHTAATINSGMGQYGGSEYDNATERASAFSGTHIEIANQWGEVEHRYDKRDMKDGLKDNLAQANGDFQAYQANYEHKKANDGQSLATDRQNSAWQRGYEDIDNQPASDLVSTEDVVRDFNDNMSPQQFARAVKPQQAAGQAAAVDLVKGHRRHSIDSMRHEEIQNKPWMLEDSNGKLWAVDGNHRVAAMRTRGEGEVEAHVMSTKDWGLEGHDQAPQDGWRRI